MAYDKATGQSTVFNVTTSTVLKASPGRIISVYIITEGTTRGSVHDTNLIANANVNTKICAIPATLAGQQDNIKINIDCPFQTGLTIVPGTGSILAVLFT